MSAKHQRSNTRCDDMHINVHSYADHEQQMSGAYRSGSECRPLDHGEVNHAVTFHHNHLCDAGVMLWFITFLFAVIFIRSCTISQIINRHIDTHTKNPRILTPLCPENDSNNINHDCKNAQHWRVEPQRTVDLLNKRLGSGAGRHQVLVIPRARATVGMRRTEADTKKVYKTATCARNHLWDASTPTN